MALTADQITAQNFKDFYMQILPYLGKGGGGGSMNYSTDEQVVGTWIDGKPIYQKTFTGTCTIPKANNTSTYLLDLTSLNIENDISIDGYFNEGDNKIPMNGISVWDSATFAIGTHYSYTQKKLSVHNVWSPITNGSYTITLRYTKTTD